MLRPLAGDPPPPEGETQEPWPELLKPPSISATKLVALPMYAAHGALRDRPSDASCGMAANPHELVAKPRESPAKVV